MAKQDAPADQGHEKRRDKNNTHKNFKIKLYYILLTNKQTM